MPAHEQHIPVFSADPLEGTPIEVHEGTLIPPLAPIEIAYPEARGIDAGFRLRRLGRVVVGGASEFMRTVGKREKVSVGIEWPDNDSLPEYGPAYPLETVADMGTDSDGDAASSHPAEAGRDAVDVTDSFRRFKSLGRDVDTPPDTSAEPVVGADTVPMVTEPSHKPKSRLQSLKSLIRPKNDTQPAPTGSSNARRLLRTGSRIGAVGMALLPTSYAADKVMGSDAIRTDAQLLNVVPQPAPAEDRLTPEQRAQAIVNGAVAGGENAAEPTETAEQLPTAPAVEEITIPTSDGEVVVGIFCAPSPYDTETGENKVSPETVIRELGGTRPELHPRCVPTGRMTTSIFVDRNPYTVELQTYPEGQRVIDQNLELLEMMKQRGGTYFVDDYRFFSGDKDLIAKAFSDYDAYVRSGTFRLEMIDEANEENTQLQINQLTVMNEVLDSQYPGVRAQDLVRPTVAITPGYRENISAFAEFGIKKIAFDAYDLEVTDRVSREIGAMPDAIRPDFLFYIPATEWVHTATGELAADSTAMTPEYLESWFAKVKQLRDEGVPGFEGYAYFTGFKAEDNVLGLSFPSSLSDKANFDLAKNLTDSYVPAVNEAVDRALAGKVAENQRVLDRVTRSLAQRGGPR